MRVTRRQVLGALGGGALGGCGVSGCSTGVAGSSNESTSVDGASAGSDGYPVTIQHAFGSTQITAPPQRVATLDWSNDDFVMEFGVVPVTVAALTWGNDTDGLTDWKQEKLRELGASLGSEKAPSVVSESDGVNLVEIAKATPDLIVANYSAMSAEVYTQLSKIAPVIAQPAGQEYKISWEDNLRRTGAALGMSAKAEELVTSATAAMDARATEIAPIAKGTSAMWMGFTAPDTREVKVFATGDPRARFLNGLGFVTPDVVSQLSAGTDQHSVSVAQERAIELVSDVVIVDVMEGFGVQELRVHPAYGQIPAVRAGRIVPIADTMLSMAIIQSSPMALKWSWAKLKSLVEESLGA